MPYAARRDLDILTINPSGWDPEQVNRRRVELLVRAHLKIAPNEKDVLVIDEHRDRKRGKHTAHVGRQWLANIGKTDTPGW